MFSLDRSYFYDVPRPYSHLIIRSTSSDDGRQPLKKKIKVEKQKVKKERNSSGSFNSKGNAPKKKSVKGKHKTKQIEQYPCPHCKKIYVREHSLIKHLELEHSKPDRRRSTKVVCKRCGNCFGDEIALQVHDTKYHPDREELRMRIKDFNDKYQ